MLAVYGVDVLDPGTSLRRVKVLAERLPPGSWPDRRHTMSWTVEAQLLAQLIDEVAALHYSTLRVYGGKPSRPKPFPRPRASAAARQAAAPGQEPRRLGWADYAAALAGQPGVVVHDG